MATNLITTTHGSLDPIALIQRSGKADSTKVKYTRALSPYLDDGGNLLDVVNLESYASRLSQSRRAHLRSALSLWAKEATLHIKGTVTEETKDRAQVLLMRLESIPQAIKVETPKGTKAHHWLTADQIRQLEASCGPDIAGCGEGPEVVDRRFSLHSPRVRTCKAALGVLLIWFGSVKTGYYFLDRSSPTLAVLHVDSF